MRFIATLRCNIRINPTVEMTFGHARVSSVRHRVILRKAALRFPGGEDGGSWTGGVFQRREPCLLPHMLGPTSARRSSRLRLPVQDVNSEYPLSVWRCRQVAGLPGCKGL